MILGLINIIFGSSKAEKQVKQQTFDVETREIVKQSFADMHNEYRLKFITTAMCGNTEVKKIVKEDPIVFYNKDAILDYSKHVVGPSEEFRFSHNAVNNNNFNYKIYKLKVNWPKLDKINEITKSVKSYTKVKQLYYICKSERTYAIHKQAFPFEDLDYFYFLSDYIEYDISVNSIYEGGNKNIIANFLLWDFKLNNCFKKLEGTENIFFEKAYNAVKDEYEFKMQKQKEKELKETLISEEVIQLNSNNDVQNVINTKLFELEMSPFNEARNKIVREELDRIDAYKENLQKLLK